MFNGKIHYKWPFSIATLNYQRVLNIETLTIVLVLIPGNLLDFLGLRHHPASSSLRSCVGELSKRPQGRMVALTDAVKVGLYQRAPEIAWCVLLGLNTIWVWVNTYRYIFSGMNIHLPAILGFTRYQGFWLIPIYHPQIGIHSTSSNHIIIVIYIYIYNLVAYPGVYWTNLNQIWLVVSNIFFFHNIWDNPSH